MTWQRGEADHTPPSPQLLPGARSPLPARSPSSLPLLQLNPFTPKPRRQPVPPTPALDVARQISGLFFPPNLLLVKECQVFAVPCVHSSHPLLGFTRSHTASSKTKSDFPSYAAQPCDACFPASTKLSFEEDAGWDVPSPCPASPGTGAAVGRAQPRLPARPGARRAPSPCLLPIRKTG